MQIAGSVTAPTVPDGFMRVHRPAFRPSEADKKVYFLTPRTIGYAQGPTSEAVKVIMESEAKLDFALNYTATGDGVVLNWGSQIAKNPQQLNKTEAVRRSSNTTDMLKAIGDLAPLTWDNFREAAAYSLKNKPFGCVGKRNHGSHGRGKRVLVRPSRFAYDVYQQFIPNRTEWRVTVFRDKVISAMRKTSPEGTPATQMRVDFKFNRVQVIPKAAAHLAIEATKRVGLDFAGVDVIRDEDTGRFYVLETNSAPGMSPETVRRLYSCIQEVAHEGR